MSTLEQILASIETADVASAAKHQWQPEYEGRIDIRITRDGRWYHEGRPFLRNSLVKLFASVLRREADSYFLVTPSEKLRIEVEDAPFVANLLETIDEEGIASLVFTTNMDERIILDSEHPLRIETDPESGEPRPYIHLRDGLEALITRSAFYDLVSQAKESERDGICHLMVSSQGQEFDLGTTEE